MADDDCEVAGHCLLPQLRARLDEVEAELSEERDHATEAWQRARHLQGLLQAAERGESKQIRRAEAAEARLAAVRALCDDADRLGHPLLYVSGVRAAAEGDRGPQDEACDPASLCPGQMGWDGEPDCGTCWGCQRDVDGRAAATEENSAEAINTVHESFAYAADKLADLGAPGDLIKRELAVAWLRMPGVAAGYLLHKLMEETESGGRAAERVEGAIKLGANPAVRETQNSAETPADHIAIFDGPPAEHERVRAMEAAMTYRYNVTVDHDMGPTWTRLTPSDLRTVMWTCEAKGWHYTITAINLEAGKD